MSSNSEQRIADRYVLRRELGRGGMGIVWEAYDTALDRVVAIKQVLLPGHFTDAERDDAHARVRREARSAARVNHPTVITIHDVFEHEHDPWVVMELVEGGSLQETLAEEGALSPDRVAEIAVSLLEAVRAADAAGVLHRDIKPGNIMMSADGRVILTDFGIATVEGGPSITRTGALIGSPEYMPPERLEGAPADHRGDLWSIGVTMYAAVEGSSPFRRDSITAAIAAVISAPMPPMTRAGWLEPVISGLLERDPERRFTVDQALGSLTDLRSGSAGSAGATAVAAAAGVPSGPQGPVADYSTDPHHGGGHHGSGAYPNAAAHAAPVAPPPPHEPGRRSRKGPMIAMFAAAAALLLVAGFVLVVALRSDETPTDSAADSESGQESTGDQGGQGEQGDQNDQGGGEGAGQNDAPAAADGTPPEYDEDDLLRYASEWFTISYPGGWEIGSEDLENSYASFVAPGLEHQIDVEGWEETEFTGTSAEYLALSQGGTDIDGDVTRDYEVLESEDFEGDDFEGGLAGMDVAMVEADLVNDTWDDSERRFWAYSVIMNEGEERVFYLVTVNVPRAQADDFDEVHEDVIETFTPLK
ncbi:serine/threonine-protein kinase [Nocardiopsis sp. NPDC055551]|uniref:serine/threonine-protein kinase n=1 Tax=Nocardiopsis sp. NPDC006832 TaxID=3157188 RepID=UPI0033C523AE